MRTMLGWSKRAAMRASSRNMETKSSDAERSGSTRLMTTSFSKPLMPRWLARKISAMPPCANFRSSWYLPNSAWGGSTAELVTE
jgi:hypothetical protein